MSEQPSLNIEGLARLDLRPDEILAVTLAVPDLTAQQCEEAQSYIAARLHEYGQPVAGVLVLPQGSQLAAIRAPKPVTVNVDFSGTKWTSAQMDEFVREFTKRIQRQPPRQH